jgi:hypothetical protein
MFKNLLKRYDPISGQTKREEIKQMKNDWLHQANPIERHIYHILPMIKLVFIALFVYLFILTVSEMIFTLQSANPRAVGHYYTKPKGGIKVWHSPKIKINVVGVGVKNSLFKNQTNTMRSFVVNANVIEESLRLEYQ